MNNKKINKSDTKTQNGDTSTRKLNANNAQDRINRNIERKSRGKNKYFNKDFDRTYKIRSEMHNTSNDLNKFRLLNNHEFDERKYPASTSINLKRKHPSSTAKFHLAERLNSHKFVDSQILLNNSATSKSKSRSVKRMEVVQNFNALEANGSVIDFLISCYRVNKTNDEFKNCKINEKNNNLSAQKILKMVHNNEQNVNMPFGFHKSTMSSARTKAFNVVDDNTDDYDDDDDIDMNELLMRIKQIKSHKKCIEKSKKNDDLCAEDEEKVDSAEFEEAQKVNEVETEEQEQEPPAKRLKIAVETDAGTKFDIEEQEQEPQAKRLKIAVQTDASTKTKIQFSTENLIQIMPSLSKTLNRWWPCNKTCVGFVNWHTLEHKGPVFAPAYKRLPKNVHFYYEGKLMELTSETEEAATFYAKMLHHDYCKIQLFNNNFFEDFRKIMTTQERKIIKDFNKCNFEEIYQYFVAESAKLKNATKQEKQFKRQQNEKLIQEYGYCIIDGRREKLLNFRLEIPGLFRGRGEHPKMGMIKRRIQAEDIIINCGIDSKIPEPPVGHHWKDIRHINDVFWLVSWIENVRAQSKYVTLNSTAKLKCEKDQMKYETARDLAKSIDDIRATYYYELNSSDLRVRQRAVALYFIDKLALRAGNEKDEDQADTVGCCSLRVEHVKLYKQLNGKENIVVFDFLGKDSIRYYNEVEVEERVFNNVALFMEHKQEGNALFDLLNAQILNLHLKDLMDGLTAKVFRTYNASITLQNKLDILTDVNMTLSEKLVVYNRANSAVALLCNHQRKVPKGHERAVEKLKMKIYNKHIAIEKCRMEHEEFEIVGNICAAEKKDKQLKRLKEVLKNLECQLTVKDENKRIALSTSKMNYLDPRITVAWCVKYQVPIEKIFNKTLRNKFKWAIDMADENYRF